MADHKLVAKEIKYLKDKYKNQTDQSLTTICTEGKGKVNVDLYSASS